MNCIIIEDEDNLTKRLEGQLKRTGYEVEVAAKIDSVEGAVSWLNANRTDLIFLDIQLGDGLGFEIFDHVQVRTPVIFTTSFDKYITKAFEVNSLSYLLKPVILNELIAALDKFKFLNEKDSSLNEKVVTLNRQYQQRFLVKNGTGLQPMIADDIAYFYVQNKHFLFIVTKNKQQFLFDSTLEVLEQRLDPKKFFRINRQFIVSFDSIRQVTSYDNRGRVKLEMEPACKEEMIVSMYRAAEFRAWLEE